MGRGKWWSEDEIVVLMAAGIEVLSLGAIDSRKKQACAKTFYNSNGAYLRSHGVVDLSDAQLDSRTARNIWEKFHQILSIFRNCWLPTFKSIGQNSEWTEEDVDKHFKDKILQKVKVREFKAFSKAWKRYGPQGLGAEVIVGNLSMDLAALAPAPDGAQDPDAHEEPEQQAVEQQPVEQQQPAKPQLPPSTPRAACPENPTKRAMPQEIVEPVEESSHLQDMATAQLLEQKLKSIQYLISISEGEEERKHLKSVLYDEVMNVCGSAKKRKSNLHPSAAGMADTRSEQARPASASGERDKEHPNKRYNGRFAC